MIPEIIDTLGTSIATASIMLAGGYKLTEMMIDRKLAEFEIHFSKRLNGTYVRSAECALLHKESIISTDYMEKHLETLEDGIKHIRTLMDKRIP